MVSLQNFLQLDDYNGVPLAAGKIYVYKQGRTELAEIYSDINGETPIANPAILDDLGMQEIYVSNVYNYTVVVTDPYNNELFTRDIYPNGVDGSGNNRLYEGIDPIVVNNDKMAISAKKATLSVQDPLYFVEDSQSAVCIGLQESAYSGLPYIENSALGFDTDGNVSSISGNGFYALSAGSASLSDSANLAGSATIADSASISYSAENAGLVTDGWETGSDGRITAYNGTAFSAGKVYSGISPVYVDNTNNQIGVSSKDFLANSPLYFTEYSDRVELSISGLPPTPGLMYESGFNYESGKITGYNGSGISAGKVYSGISPVTVDNVNDTISVASATLGVQSPLFFVEDSESATVIGLNSAQIHVDIPESANWNEAYSTVNNNSGDWQSAADELAVLNTAKWDDASNTLSSNSADWNNKLDADIYAEDSGNFYTKDNPSGFITGVDLTPYQLTADMTGYLTTGDSSNFYTTANESGFITGVDLTDYATKDFVNDNVASSISGKLDIATYSSESGNFLTTADSSEFYPMTGNPSGFLTGETDWTNTITAASAHAYSEATAQIPTDYATTAQLADKLDSAIYANDSGTFLTAHQPISANEWNSVYDTVSDNSAGWTGGSTYTGDAQGALDEVYSNSANWNSTYTTVSSNSATWGQGGSDGIVVIDMTLGSYDPHEIYNTINSSWGLKSIYAKVDSTPTTYSPDRTLYLPVNIRYPYDDGASQSGYMYEGHYQYYVDGQYALNGQQFQVGYDSINDNYVISTPQINPDMQVPIAWPSDDGRVLTVRDDGGIEWRAPQGGDLPQSAADAIDVVTGGSANWNSTTATVSTNSGAWGGSGIEISAGFGINIQLVDNKLVISLATATGDI